MGFTRDVKLELGTIVPAAEHCRRAQLSGLLFGAGVFEIGPGGHYGVRVSLAPAGHGPPRARRCSSRFGVDAELRTVDARAARACATRCCSATRPRDLQVLNELGVLSDDLARADDACRGGWSSGAAAWWPSCAGSSSAAARSRRRARRCTPSSPSRTRASPSRSQRLLARLGPAVLARRARAQRRLLHASAGRRPPTCSPCSARTTACLRWEEHAVLGDGARERQPARQLRRGQRAAGGGGRRRGRPPPRARSWRRREWAALPARCASVAELRVEYPYLSLQELAGRAPTRRSAGRRSTTACAGSLALAGELDRADAAAGGLAAGAAARAHMLRAARIVSSPSRYV